MGVNQARASREDLVILAGFDFGSGALKGFCVAREIPLESLDAVVTLSPALATGGFCMNEMRKLYAGKYDAVLSDDIKMDIAEQKSAGISVDEKTKKVEVQPPVPLWVPPFVGLVLGSLGGGALTAVGYGIGYAAGYFTK